MITILSLLEQMGKFYELFEMDADVGAKELDLQYMKGYRVLVVEQTETPEQLELRRKEKSSKDKELEDRKVLLRLAHLYEASLYRVVSRKEKPRGRHHGLTQQKRQEIKEAFELFDTDGSVKLKKEDGVYYMSYAMGRGCLTFGEMMQKISNLKDGSTMERLYMLIFISGKNKNENMEMECVIEFPHTHMDRRPRRSRLGWDIAPQALRKEQQRKTLNDCPNTNSGGLVTLRKKMGRFKNLLEE
ncbi:DNA mismatch repair protein MSH6 [Camellia lanceoleosa]|uniref:DNA mismatch repair protein MSH6 n=1 Tax=Camellia lanceoleosa TaxID=1840588 RepID=A0ACC0J223_9ERIC|nr:DNA mismatch repair protein MSH6 [Camellia lanceoleosa]